MSVTTLLSRLRRVPVVGWIAGVLVLAIGVTALLGGFREGTTVWQGVEIEPGETAYTRFWEVTAYEAQVNDWGPYIEVATELTNNFTRPVTVDAYLIVVRLPELGFSVSSPSCSTENSRPFNPGVRVTALCSFRVPDERELDLTGVSELELEVIVFEQVFSDSILDPPSPESDHPLAFYRMTAPVNRR